MRIRVFDLEDDYQNVRDLWAKAGLGIQLSRSDRLEEIQKKLERDPDLFLVAEKKGRIIGTVMGGFDGRRGLVYHLAVAHSHRRQGVAKQLMLEVEKRLSLKGCLKYYLLVTPENQQAIQFYQDIGCEQMDLRVLGKEIA